MHGAVARLCMVVVAAILNQPLLFPKENTTLPDEDEELIARMREHEERLKIEQVRLEKELSQLEYKQEKIVSEDCYTWHFWSVVIFLVLFAIEMCRMDFADVEVRPGDDEDVFLESGLVNPRTMPLDKDSLNNFCNKCTYASAHENWRVKEFSEGFGDDLLESLRHICDKYADLEVGDFVGIGSMFESWKVCKPLTCDLIVPFSLPELHSFQFHLWCSPASNIPPDMHGCGTIKVVQFGDNGEDCLCGSANLGEDMLCLLHIKNDELSGVHKSDERLCTMNTPYLAKDEVMKWFQISLTKAWGRISHKYDFEVTFHNLDAAGALKIRFRSGKVILVNLIPVVQLDDTDAYFVSHFPSDCDHPPDPYWHLSLAVYERNLLKHFTKLLPQNSCHLHCLQIVTFLHRKQTGLTGKSALTSYHFKTALLHLLLSKSSSAWAYERLEARLRDVLGLIQKSLQEKRLYHVLVGNRKVPKEIQLPKRFFTAEHINLFRSLVLQRDLYTNTVRLSRRC
ncbi:inositol 1,4,5-trisphosphate receptor-interacting protein [Thalassophryne amazonica]|uniref:inositol 1,4,5-trisphosphate receptor-interacting protein n=1 Tax=Thalassophryne amazonica TaxID=390379 RepID=UPI00147102F3|nr:inositol 1,4,5-trisphosphate receptor-interacting protein [Thalassophryne amazonica]